MSLPDQFELSLVHRWVRTWTRKVIVSTLIIRYCSIVLLRLSHHNAKDSRCYLIKRQEVLRTISSQDYQVLYDHKTRYSRFYFITTEVQKRATLRPIMCKICVSQENLSEMLCSFGQKICSIVITPFLGGNLSGNLPILLFSVLLSQNWPPFYQLFWQFKKKISGKLNFA